MTRSKKRASATTSIAIALLLPIVFPQAHGEDADYTQAIDAEAAKLAPPGLPANLFHDRNTIQKMQGTITDARVPTDTMEAFERYLECHLHGSYGYFKGLSKRQQQRVFEAAKTHPRVPSIRNHIVELYFGAPRLSHRR